MASFPLAPTLNQSPASLSLLSLSDTHNPIRVTVQGEVAFGAVYASSSLSSMLGIPLEIGNSRPDSGHCRQPSITSTCNTHRQTGGVRSPPPTAKSIWTLLSPYSGFGAGLKGLASTSLVPFVGILKYDSTEYFRPVVPKLWAVDQ